MTSLIKRILSGRAIRLALRVLGGVALAGLAVWSTMAIYYSGGVHWLRTLSAVVFVLGILAVSAWVRRPWLRRAALLGMCAIVIAWFLLLPASNNRDWQPDVATLPYADIGPDEVTIHNIRNCDYRTEKDYTIRHYDRTFELDKLSSTDLFVVYWGSPLIAHTMLSFGFGQDDYVCFSIETRKEQGETYSALKGFFRQYELTYVVGDERDLVRLRTNYRHEQVYLYRLSTDPAVARNVFLDYLREINRLKDHPEWYNALSCNCTTNIRGHTRPYAKNARFDWRILLNGRVDEMAYERKSLDSTFPFQQLKALSLINERAAAASEAAFSTVIREGLPGIATPQTASAPPLAHEATR